MFRQGRQPLVYLGMAGHRKILFDIFFIVLSKMFCPDQTRGKWGNPHAS
jgi:hypothetical protein